MKTVFASFIVFLFVIAMENSNAQTTAGGVIVPYVIEHNDTFPILTLPDFVVVSKRVFKSSFEQNKYNALKRNVILVYPYAKHAGDIFKEVQQELADKDSKRDRKKFLKQKEKELDEQFKEPLKNLTTVQGELLVKLIARETGQNCYELIKDLKSPVSAFFWNNASKLWGYDIKVAYDPQEDKDIELIVRAIENKF